MSPRPPTIAAAIHLTDDYREYISEVRLNPVDGSPYVALGLGELSIFVSNVAQADRLLAQVTALRAAFGA